MDARLHRRIQRYGWDLAAPRYEELWGAQLVPAQAEMLALARPAQGERVLDLACGTGVVSLQAARAVGPRGHVLGIDVSERMIDEARERANRSGLPQARFERMDAEALTLGDAPAGAGAVGGFDLILCALGLMYMPAPEQALLEARRVLRPGGRIALAVWGEPARCGWSCVFATVDAEVASDVCPLFFRLSPPEALVRLCAQAGFGRLRERRIAVTLDYQSADEACDAALIGGPVALAWSRFDEATRHRVRERYAQAIAPWRVGHGYRVPGEFVIVAGRAESASS